MWLPPPVETIVITFSYQFSLVSIEVKLTSVSKQLFIHSDKHSQNHHQLNLASIQTYPNMVTANVSEGKTVYLYYFLLLRF